MHILRFSAAFLCILVLSGCLTATGSLIITGIAKPAINPSEVKIYLDPPSEYETIGLIEASVDVGLSAQIAQDLVIQELKNQAAKAGANGVLLINIGTQSDGMVGFYSGNVFIADSTERRIMQARAIYITE